MNSLRGRLTLALCGALLVVGLMSALASYVLAAREADQLLDDQMQEIARLVGAQPFDQLAPAAVKPRLDPAPDDADDFAVTVDDAQGHRLYSSRESGSVPAQPGLGFRTLLLGKEALRLYSARSRDRQITVAQRVKTREKIANGAALSSLLPFALLLPVLGLAIGFVTQRQLRPLRLLAGELAGRSRLSLAQLIVADIPSEVRPLVDEINALLERLRQALEADQRFIEDAAHALRTPLTALQLQAAVLDGSPDPAEQRLRLAELRAGICRTVKLADQLLLLGRQSARVPTCQSLELQRRLPDSFRAAVPARPSGD